MVPIVIKFGNRHILIENALHSYIVSEITVSSESLEMLPGENEVSAMNVCSL